MVLTARRPPLGAPCRLPDSPLLSLTLLYFLLPLMFCLGFPKQTPLFLTTAFPLPSIPFPHNPFPSNTPSLAFFELRGGDENEATPWWGGVPAGTAGISEGADA